eukprot:g1439.t1
MRRAFNQLLHKNPLTQRQTNHEFRDPHEYVPPTESDDVSEKVVFHASPNESQLARYRADNKSNGTRLSSSANAMSSTRTELSRSRANARRNAFDKESGYEVVVENSHSMRPERTVSNQSVASKAGNASKKDNEFGLADCPLCEARRAALHHSKLAAQSFPSTIFLTHSAHLDPPHLPPPPTLPVFLTRATCSTHALMDHVLQSLLTEMRLVALAMDVNFKPGSKITVQAELHSSALPALGRSPRASPDHKETGPAAANNSNAVPAEQKGSSQAAGPAGPGSSNQAAPPTGVPSHLQQLKVAVTLNTDAPEQKEQLLVGLAENNSAVMQALQSGPAISLSFYSVGGGSHLPAAFSTASMGTDISMLSGYTSSTSVGGTTHSATEQEWDELEEELEEMNPFRTVSFELRHDSVPVASSPLNMEEAEAQVRTAALQLQNAYYNLMGFLGPAGWARRKSSHYVVRRMNDFHDTSLKELSEEHVPLRPANRTHTLEADQALASPDSTPPHGNTPPRTPPKRAHQRHPTLTPPKLRLGRSRTRSTSSPRYGAPGREGQLAASSHSTLQNREEPVTPTRGEAWPPGEMERVSGQSTPTKETPTPPRSSSPPSRRGRQGSPRRLSPTRDFVFFKTTPRTPAHQQQAAEQASTPQQQQAQQTPSASPPEKMYQQRWRRGGPARPEHSHANIEGPTTPTKTGRSKGWGLVARWSPTKGATPGRYSRSSSPPRQSELLPRSRSDSPVRETTRETVVSGLARPDSWAGGPAEAHPHLDRYDEQQQLGGYKMPSATRQSPGAPRTAAATGRNDLSLEMNGVEMQTHSRGETPSPPKNSNSGGPVAPNSAGADSGAARHNHSMRYRAMRQMRTRSSSPLRAIDLAMSSLRHARGKRDGEADSGRTTPPPPPAQPNWPAVELSPVGKVEVAVGREEVVSNGSTPTKQGYETPPLMTPGQAGWPESPGRTPNQDSTLSPSEVFGWRERAQYTQQFRPEDYPEESEEEEEYQEQQADPDYPEQLAREARAISQEDQNWLMETSTRPVGPAHAQNGNSSSPAKLQLQHALFPADGQEFSTPLRQPSPTSDTASPSSPPHMRKQQQVRVRRPATGSAAALRRPQAKRKLVLPVFPLLQPGEKVPQPPPCSGPSAPRAAQTVPARTVSKKKPASSQGQGQGQAGALLQVPGATSAPRPESTVKRKNSRSAKAAVGS